MDKRKSDILEAVVEEFINFGEPISSSTLYEYYDFGIKPAMIRFELESLSEDGFLEQPHISSGRVPTDLGYEFFASRILEREKKNNLKDARIKNLFLKQEWNNFVYEFSSKLNILSILADFDNEKVYKIGLENLIENLDWNDKKELNQVIRDFEEIDNELFLKKGKTENTPSVFVGDKSPVTKSKNISVICGRYNVDGSDVEVFCIGPKRMDYRKVIKTLKGLEN
jgi:transcriptional regulator of heat shock response